MVSPLFIIAVALGAGFLIPLVAQFASHGTDRGADAGAALFYVALVALVAIPASWIVPLANGSAVAEAFTAGVRPPLSINLRMGLNEAVVLTIVNGVALFATFVMAGSLRKRGGTGHVLVLMMVLGANGLVLTRDLFNAFVFLEILSIGTYGIIALDDRPKQFAAGFKYLIAGGLSSMLFLLGTVYLYHLTGTLNIDGMIAAVRAGALDNLGGGGVLAIGAGFTAPFLLFAGLLIELKVFPANGWALDTYEASNPGVASIISAANATAVILLVDKILPILPASLLSVLLWVGLLTFAISNLLGLRQENPRRMLGYSSVAQIGLVSAVLALTSRLGLPQTYVLLVPGGLLVNHLLAKAGLFWIAGVTRRDGVEPAKATRRLGPITGIAAVVLGLALVGLPPFPAFWAKWQLVHTLLAGKYVALLVLLLVGTLFEAIYILRWVGTLVARDSRPAAGATESDRAPAPVALALTFVAAALAAAGYWWGRQSGVTDLISWGPAILAAALLVFEWLPSRIKGLLAIAAVGAYAWYAYPQTGGMSLIFGAVFAAGAIAALIASLFRRRSGFGYYPLFVLAATGLTGLAVAREPLSFFLMWEFMTVGSYLLIARSSRMQPSGSPMAGDGPGAPAAALRYIGFSTAAALLIMTGLLVALNGVSASPGLLAANTALPLIGASAGQTALGAWAATLPSETAVAIFVLLGLGFLTKMGAMGLHIWLPDAYAEANDEVSSFLSSSLSKAGLFGIVLLLVMVGDPVVGTAAGGAGVGMNVILGWVGAITALLGALLAIFQEDVKKLFAYSSLSQVGYMVLVIALSTHLGWLAGIYNAVNHFIFKGLLFLGMTGVILRTGTRYMYEMGGLIKRMPLTFISVLMAIIALSGVPPLAGFGGKWLIYGALIESKWYLQAGVAFFASTIAFLYLFRMIYSVFLGQLKDNLREVKEAPAAILIPQVVLMGLLMVISMYPTSILRPIIAAIEPYLATTVHWNDYTVITALGYWNGHAVMYVTIAVFVLPLVWIMLVMRRPQKVGQFNIVYSAERPERPETTHYAHNFFAPYRKALGFLAAPVVKRGWAYVIEGVGSVAGAIRQFYTGNGQTYALHILLMTVILYFIAGGM